MEFLRSLYDYMQNKKPIDYCLKFDRILDANNQIYVGIGTRKTEADKDKTLQVIRIGDYTNKYYRLINFVEKENKLKYEFENDITLTLTKKNIKDIRHKHVDSKNLNDSPILRNEVEEYQLIQLKLLDLNNNKVISTEIDPTIIKYYKPINMVSVDLDKIHSFFNS